MQPSGIFFYPPLQLNVILFQHLLSTIRWDVLPPFPSINGDILIMLFLSASSIAWHNGRKWIPWIVFPTDFPLHSTCYYMSLSLFFAHYVCQTRGLQKTKKNTFATGIASFMQQNLHTTQISSCQKQDRCPINSSSKNVWVFYRRHSRKTHRTEVNCFSLYPHSTRQTFFFFHRHI